MIVKVFTAVIAFSLVFITICIENSAQKHTISYPSKKNNIPLDLINKNENDLLNQEKYRSLSNSNITYDFVKSMREEFTHRQVYDRTTELTRYLSDKSSCVDGIFVNVEVVCDALPSFHNDGWDIVQLSSKEIVWSSSFYDKPYEFYNESKCLDIGEYRFTFSDYSRVGIIGEGTYYKLRVNNKVLKETFGPKRFHLETTYFGYCSSDSHCDDYDECTNEFCDLLTKTCKYEFTRYSSENCRAFGLVSALAIRVIALDTETTGSETEISRSIFGSNGEFSMSSQFSSCSYGRLNISSFKGITGDGVSINDGVLSVPLDMNVTGEAANLIGSLALSTTYENVKNLTKNTLVIVCLPPKTRIGISENWKAYAFVNAFHSIYNDLNCLYPSVLMHEIGHNFGLSHSNDNKNYGDESGMMGVSYSNTDGPQKCFNAPKSWELGWYSDSHILIDVSEINQSAVVELVGISDYINRKSRATLLKIINGNDSYDYYVTFNRKNSMNSETGEGGDMILISKRPAGLLYADSTLLHIFNIGGYAVLKFDGATTLNLKVKVIEEEGVLVAQVALLLWTSFCRTDSQCNDSNQCTDSSCQLMTPGIGFCVHKPIEKCTICGNEVTIEVLTNNIPESLTWEIFNTAEEKVPISSGYYSEPHTFYTRSECLAFGSYKFSITNSRNSTLENSQTFSLAVGDSVIDEGEIIGTNILETNFIICSNDQDCHDYDGCTLDYCNPETTLCENIQYTNKTACYNCSWISIDIKMDNFPEETTWEIVIMDSSSLLISGDPYPLYLHKNGRRKNPTKAGRSKAPTRSSALHMTYTDDDEDDKLILESFCAENNIKFGFTITDSFGDGICCTEGYGKYMLKSIDEIIMSGSDFGDQDSIVFKFSKCFFDSDCDDNDLCSEDKCSSSKSVCLYSYLPCDQCGASTTIQFYTDYYPTETKWTLSKLDQELLSAGPYEATKTKYESSICLSYGSYFLKIDDYSAISWCCNYGLDLPNEIAECVKTEYCGFKILIDDKVILSGGDNVISFHQKQYFGICNKDSDCEDFDDCTEDKCDLSLNVCKFDPLPCSECSKDPCDHSSSCIDPSPCSACGKTLVTVDIHTDIYPVYTSWFLNSWKESQGTTIAFGQYYGKTYHHYKHQICLENGRYEFSVADIGTGVGAGVLYCNNLSVQCGNWSISVETSLLKSGNRNFTGVDSTIFEVSQPTSAPMLISSTNSASITVKPITSIPTILSQSKSPIKGSNSPHMNKMSKRPTKKSKRKVEKKKREKKSLNKKKSKTKSKNKKTKKNKQNNPEKENKRNENKSPHKEKKTIIIPFQNAP